MSNEFIFSGNNFGQINVGASGNNQTVLHGQHCSDCGRDTLTVTTSNGVTTERCSNKNCQSRDRNR